jgi:hypothetical protein
LKQQSEGKNNISLKRIAAFVYVCTYIWREMYIYTTLVGGQKCRCIFVCVCCARRHEKRIKGIRTWRISHWERMKGKKKKKRIRLSLAKVVILLLLLLLLFPYRLLVFLLPPCL